MLATQPGPFWGENPAPFCCLCSLAHMLDLLGVEVASAEIEVKTFGGELCCPFPPLTDVTYLAKIPL